MAGEWLQQLPEDLRTNEAFTGHATLGDFAKSHLDAQGKLKEFDGKVKENEGKIGDLEKKLGNTIPKLPENATDQEKEVFYLALGKPEKSEEYEFPEEGEVKHDEKMVSWARDTFHKANLSKEQGKTISQLWDGFIQEMSKSEIATREKERVEAETKLKTELGDKYDGTVEMVKRVWKKLSDSEFDTFANETKIGNDTRMIRFVMNVAKKIGSDASIQSLPGKGEEETGWYPKTKF